MAEILNEDFEDGTLGAAVTTGNTTAFVIDQNGGTGVFSGDAVEGALAFRVTTTTSARRSAWFQHTSGAVSFHRWYHKLDEIGTANVIIGQVLATSTVLSQVQVRGSGGNVVRIFDGGNSAATSTDPVPLGQWVRYELRVNGTADTQELRVYWGANLHGTTPNITLNGAYTVGATQNRLAVGLVAAAANVDMHVDAIVGDDSDWVGPLEIAGQLDTPDNFTFNRVIGLRQINAAWSTVAGADHYEVEVQTATSSTGPWTPLEPDDVFTPTTSPLSIDHTDGIDWARFYRGRIRAIPAGD